MLNFKCFFPIALLVFAFLGCTSNIPTFPVEGMVTFKGKALPKGEIYFDPDISIKGPQGRALIHEGKFSTKDLNSGIVPGKYIIRIHGFDGKPREEAPMGKALFPAYELPMELIAGKPGTIEPSHGQFHNPQGIMELIAGKPLTIEVPSK